MRAWVIGLMLVLLGCESSNTTYYFVCLHRDLSYKRGRFHGFIHYDQAQEQTTFVDPRHKVAVVPGQCMYMAVGD